MWPMCSSNAWRPPRGVHWLDVGCGTGSLTSRIVAACAPASVLGVDPSAGFVERAEAACGSGTTRFETGFADALPAETDSADVIVSALAYNFVPDRGAALAEFGRVCRTGGTIALYVWDYPGGGVGFIDEFWKPAARLDAAAARLDEAGRFPVCTETTLAGELTAAGFEDVSVDAIVIPTPFADFDSFWHPFTLGAGPAPGYLAGLPPERRTRLRDALEADLADRTASLTARAWALTSVNAGRAR